MNRKMPGWVALLILILLGSIVVRFGMGIHSTLANLDTRSQEKIRDFEEQVSQQAQKNHKKAEERRESEESDETIDLMREE